MVLPSDFILYIITVISTYEFNQAAAVGIFVKSLAGKGFILKGLEWVTKL